MNKRKLLFLGAFLLVAMTALAACSQGTQQVQPQPTVTVTKTQETHPIATMYELECSFGWGSLEDNLVLDGLMGRTHPWLRRASQETPGYVYNLKTIIDSPVKRKDTMIATNDYILNQAAKKAEPYTDGFKDYANGILTNQPANFFGFVTLDPNIKTLEDLKGKRVANGPAGGTSAQIMNQIMEVSGIKDGLKSLDHVSLDKIPGLLLDGLADVGLVAGQGNPPSGKIVRSPILEELNASGKKIYYVDISADSFDKFRAAYFDGLVTAALPPGTMPQQDVVVNWPNHLRAHAADINEFPEDLAYEYAKWYLDNMDALVKAAGGGTSSTMTREFLVWGWDKADFHPGAVKAYEEAGLFK